MKNTPPTCTAQSARGHSCSRARLHARAASECRREGLLAPLIHGGGRGGGGGGWGGGEGGEGGVGGGRGGRGRGIGRGGRGEEGERDKNEQGRGKGWRLKESVWNVFRGIKLNGRERKVKWKILSAKRTAAAQKGKGKGEGRAGEDAGRPKRGKWSRGRARWLPSGGGGPCSRRRHGLNACVRATDGAPAGARVPGALAEVSEQGERNLLLRQKLCNFKILICNYAEKTPVYPQYH